MGILLGLGIVTGVLTAGTGDLLLTASAGLAILIGIFVAPPGTRRLAMVAGVGFAGGCISGMFHHEPAQRSVAISNQETYFGIITDDPKLAGSGVVATVHWFDDHAVAHDTRMYLPTAPTIARGDHIEFGGSSGETNEAVLFVLSMRVMKRAGRVERVRQSIRDWFEGNIRRTVPGSPGSLTLGLLIGDDSALTAEEAASLRSTGLSHITAVSGWNVSVVIMTLATLLRAFGRTGGRWFIVQMVGILFYVWIVGPDPPIIRAAVMGAAGLIAIQIGRPAHMLTLLSLTAALMIPFAPNAVSSLSFQLSFLSMLGISIVYPLVDRLETGYAGLVAAILTPVAALLATAPLIAARFGTFALLTVPVNVVVAPLVPASTYLGFLAGLLGFVPILGAAVGTLAWLLTSLILEISRLADAVPGTYWTFEPVSDAGLFGIYAAIGLCLAPLVAEMRELLWRLVEWVENQPLQAAVSGMAMATVLALSLVRL